ncbi:MAG: GNAT family N-acetyltransferase [Candidatus Promineifilaceae bacterium]|nr:GNAT family N-acetyltransferase [Candidatus Promineifilaceae bacterium]
MTDERTTASASAQPTLSTDRLELRPFALSDAGRVQRLAGDRQVALTTANIPHPYEDGMAEEWINKHADVWEERAGVTFAMELRKTGEVIGAIGLRIVRQHQRAEIGYWVGRPWWSKGYATEAAGAILAFAFEGLGLQRVYAAHVSRNPASGRVMQKLGMSHEGRFRRHFYRWGRFDDLEYYGILRSEYFSVED